VSETQTSSGTPSGQAFPCQNCGAKLTYDAGTQAMKCPYCGFQQAVPSSPAVTPGGHEIPIEEGFKMAVRGFGTPLTQVTCSDCGATVNVTPGEQTAKCTFCGSQQVLAQESAGTAIRPESLVPFKMAKEKANESFEKWLGALWFRPSDLKKMAKLQEMGGVYIPFWTFDAWVRSNWNADAGYYYYETEYYTDENGDQQSRQIQRTRWEPASGQRNDFFDDVLVCASKGLPPELVMKFTSFDTKQLVAYQPEFLSGWRAESYAIDLMPAWQAGQQEMASTQEQRCAADVPGDTHRGLRVNHAFGQVTFKHVLLPVWIAAYRYNGKPYQFLVNGQTGEVVGKAPWSFWKIFALCVFIAAAIAAAVFLFRDQERKSNGSSNPPAAAPARGPRGPASRQKH
jgi:DNA-directed RNA polymerase subunit RPC12/RpoP